MYLYINAVDPRSDIELGVFDGTWKLEHRPRAEQGGVLKTLDNFVIDHKIEWSKVRTLFVLMGAGSFTATRSVATVANLLALSKSLKVCGVTNFAEQNPEDLLSANQPASQYILPRYSAPARIGKPSI